MWQAERVGTVHDVTAARRSPTTSSINGQVLAATNQLSSASREQDRFRRDLYFRLAVIILKLPPLREQGARSSWAEEFLARFRAEYAGKDIAAFCDTRAQELLLAYPWPGNVRELRHVIERAVLWSRGGGLDLEHLALNGAALDDSPPASTWIA